MQVVPTVLFFSHRRRYLQHGCAIMAFQRVVDIVGSCVFLVFFHNGLGVTAAHQDSFLYFVQLLVIGDGWVCVLNR